MWNKVSEYNPAVFESLLKAEGLATSPSMYADLLVPTVGNLLAFSKTRDTPGTHVRADVADMGEINDTFGYEAGNRVLQVIGKTASELAATFRGKSFRYGGDEFAFYFKAPDNAHAFARTLRATLEAIPPINGTHHIALAIGIGPDYISSEVAMDRAKSQKYRLDGSKKYEDGKPPTIIQSLITQELNKSAATPYIDPEQQDLERVKAFTQDPTKYGMVSGKTYAASRFLQDAPAENTPERWVSKEGMKRMYIPNVNNPSWKEYDENYNHLIQENYGSPNHTLIPWDDIPVDRTNPRNRVYGHDRYDLYRGMLGVGHPVPRIVVEPQGNEFVTIEGSHRIHAARETKTPSLRGFLRVPKEKAEEYKQRRDGGKL